MTTMTSTTTTASQGTRAEAVRAAVIALTLGAAITLAIGFAHASTIHNAAHDTRHALSFPCH